MVTLPAAAVGEILAEAGFDWLFLDGEHGRSLEAGEILAICKRSVNGPHSRSSAGGEEATDQEDPRPRVPRGSSSQVNTRWNGPASLVRSALSPLVASVGLARAHGYGLRFQEYLDTANDRVTVIVRPKRPCQVEQHRVDRESRGDRRQSCSARTTLRPAFGKMGRVDDPSVTDAIADVTKTCQAAGIPLGYFGLSAAAFGPTWNVSIADRRRSQHPLSRRAAKRLREELR